MFDKSLAIDILGQILEAARRIERRFSPIQKSDDFMATDDGIDRLDAIGMMLIAIGESLKNLDRVTGEQLLLKYPEVDWKGAQGVRDVISHQYFDIDADEIFTICRKDIPALISTVQKIIEDLKRGVAP